MCAKEPLAKHERRESEAFVFEHQREIRSRISLDRPGSRVPGFSASNLAIVRCRSPAAQFVADLPGFRRTSFVCHVIHHLRIYSVHRGAQRLSASRRGAPKVCATTSALSFGAHTTVVDIRYVPIISSPSWRVLIYQHTQLLFRIASVCRQFRSAFSDPRVRKGMRSCHSFESTCARART